MTRPSGIVCLMYHELELPNRAVSHSDAGYLRYVVPLQTFRDQMQLMKAGGFKGLSVSEAMHRPEGNRVALTFDDGSETDLIAAAPLLREFGFNATFYVTVSFLDRPGYLSKEQLRELCQLGCEIGSHSLSHPYLTGLDDDRLWHQIARSKADLEQITGHPVLHFSCPGGRWDQRTETMARKAGYLSLATSQAKANRPSQNNFVLNRVAILRHTTLSSFQDICSARGLWKYRLLDSSRAALKNLLGNSIYDRVREEILSRRQLR